MAKNRIILLLLMALPLCSIAGHIAGGEMYYRYLGVGSAPNTSKYEITLRLFRECNPIGSAALMPIYCNIAIYANTSPYLLFTEVRVPRAGNYSIINLSTPNPCIGNPPEVCYQVAKYVFEQDLPNIPEGYTAAHSTCCRSYGIANIVPLAIASDENAFGGATYSCNIPGTTILGNGVNSSPVFALKDTTLICKNSPFSLDFSATDPDVTDSLSYSFCSAYDRGQGSGSSSAPPFNSVKYRSAFSGTSPLGPNVTIDPVTGIISGTSPVNGSYVVTVCITEWRNGVAISEHRKDFTLRISDCSLTAAELNPTYITCDGFSITFENKSSNPTIASYLWDFGDNNATSTQPTPTHQYSAAGEFPLKLKVTNTGGCEDSATANVKIFPGFAPDFQVIGNCFQNNFVFKDATTSAFGVVDSWRWDFGDNTTLADTARMNDTAWKYPAPTNAQVRLIVTNSKGCLDTITKTVPIPDKPFINLNFRDTLICSIDTLQLFSNSNASSIAWTADNILGQLRMLNTNSTSPLVFPTDTTKYYITVADNSCINRDSIMVNVLDFISVNAGQDTTICLTDQFSLSPVSDALSYRWTNSVNSNILTEKYSLIQPLTDTRYYIAANLGLCQARDSVDIKVAPYPTVSVTPDTTICFGERLQINSIIAASNFAWSPTSALLNSNTLNPIAGPSRTILYKLSVSDTLGCPKIVSDSILITVAPPIAAYAGRDTQVVANQPLQLNASGGQTYSWLPITGLSASDIANPITTLPASIDSIIYTARVMDQFGCYKEDDIKVIVFKSLPDIFVPTAFTPNGDGKNDILKPISVGISQIKYFRIYNRWGQLLYSTSTIGNGWDGTYSGIEQPVGTYVFDAIGTDYLGNQVHKKGTVVLIR